ncbi:MAG TPA: hypothetical protein VI583_11100 [Cyclobacteriaceae bacterium]|nr:hypothetical protein [Cyclobacteriaceae bacterium]
MNRYKLETFRFNDAINRKPLIKIRVMIRKQGLTPVFADYIGAR